jgi:hypothetical protein
MRAINIFWAALAAAMSGLAPACADNVATAVSVETRAAANSRARRARSQLAPA